MAPTLAQVLAEDINSALRQMAAAFLSGTNIDGSAFSLPTTVTTGPPSEVTLVDRSGTITAGGTSQQLAAANATRQYLLVQNNSNGDLWINFGVAAVTTQPSIRLAPGSQIEYSPGGTGVIPTQAVNIIGATTGQVFTAKEV
jgi:hypothetical protein